MASSVNIYLEKYITKEEFYGFLHRCNGFRQLSDNYEQGILEKRNSNVWLHYRGNKFNLSIEELKKDFKEAKFFKTEIHIEISSEESDYLAKEFCEKLYDLYGGLYVINGENKIYDIKEINKAFYL